MTTITSARKLRAMSIDKISLVDHSTKPLRSYQRKALKRWQKTGKNNDMITKKHGLLFYINSSGGLMQLEADIMDESEDDSKSESESFDENGETIPSKKWFKQLISTYINKSESDSSDEENDEEKDSLPKKILKLLSTSSLSRQKWFERVLSIYTFEFLSHKTKLMCLKALTNDDTFENIQENTHLVVYNGEHHESDIQRSLWERVPVYFGKVMKSMFKAPQVEKLLDYEVSDKSIDQNVRYVIAGPAYISEKKYISVVHVWGVNLEKKSTYDFKKYVKGKKLRTKLYRSTVCNLLNATFTAAVMQLKNSGRKKAHVRLPLIGLGAFLEAISEKHKAKSSADFFSKLSSKLERNSPNI